MVRLSYGGIRAQQGRCTSVRNQWAIVDQRRLSTQPKREHGSGPVAEESVRSVTREQEARGKREEARVRAKKGGIKGVVLHAYAA